ncbi:MAG: right-handed parallel beta-helix repeat-containing protein, partial [Thermoplasmata archaeon]|nr:right-handed parallel beta-helix repeat-containing protein [Thermoplasmata archaeon]
MEPKTHPKMLPVLILMIALAITAMALAMTSAAEGATIVVPDDYGTIQEAIDNASAGDTIRIHAGSYTESLVVDTRVEIIGNGTGETVIQGSVPDLVQLNSDGINLSKVRIDGGSTSGVYVKGANCTIEDIYVNGSSRGLRTSGADWLYIGNSTFTANDDYGMIIHLSNNVTIYGCEVTWNDFDDGIRINAGQSNITISHTLVDTNGYRGIEFMGNTDIRVDNCTITNNSDNGIYVTGSDRMVFEDNTIQWNLLFGIYTFKSTGIEITDNLVSNNTFGIFIDNCADGEIKDNVAID